MHVHVHVCLSTTSYYRQTHHAYSRAMKQGTHNNLLQLTVSQSPITDNSLNYTQLLNSCEFNVTLDVLPGNCGTGVPVIDPEFDTGHKSVVS